MESEEHIRKAGTNSLATQLSDPSNKKTEGPGPGAVHLAHTIRASHFFCWALSSSCFLPPLLPACSSCWLVPLTFSLFSFSLFSFLPSSSSANTPPCYDIRPDEIVRRCHAHTHAPPTPHSWSHPIRNQKPVTTLDTPAHPTLSAPFAD